MGLSPRGNTGPITLLTVVVLLGAAVLFYLFVPAVHSRVGAFVTFLRGTDTQEALKSPTRPGVQIISSSRSEGSHNIVTVRGAVDNTSDEALENPAVEVSLQRTGSTPSEIRNVSVAPNPLPPRQRGTFEFEYDGTRDTGFTGYKVTRILSNGIEVKFRVPETK